MPRVRLNSSKNGWPKVRPNSTEPRCLPASATGTTPADAEPGDAAFETYDRLARLIGRDNRLAETREVVAKFLRLMDAQIGYRRRRVKLELVDAIVGFQGCKSGAEQSHQGVAVVARHRLLNRGDGRDDGAHRRGPAGLLAEPRLQRVVVAAQFALIGAIDDA